MTTGEERIFILQVPVNIQKKIKDTVRHDLNPSNGTAFLKFGIAFFAGGGLSLFFCGQFGLGLSSYAQGFNHSVHHGVGPLWCAALCGFLFSIMPVVTLRVLSRPIEFRALMRKKKGIQIAWAASIGTILSYHGRFGFEMLAVLVWALTAYLSLRVLAEVADYINRKIYAAV